MTITPKELKALAAACRKAGITSFKGQGVEFTLSPAAQPKVVKSNKKAKAFNFGPEDPETESLSPEDMLFWSVGGDDQKEPTGEQ